MNRYLWLLLCLFVFGCATNKEESFSWEKFHQENPGLYTSHYGDLKKVNLENRHIKLTPDTIKFIRTDNPMMPWIHPMVENLDDNNLNIKKIRELIQGLPTELKNLISKKVYAWSLVKNLGSSALTIQLYTDNNDANESLILIDESIFNNSTEFLSTKEASVYKTGNYQIKVQATKKLPVELYLLFHETGHAFDTKNIFTSGSETKYSKQSHVLWNPFTKQSWKWDEKESLIAKESNLENWSSTRKYYNPTPEKKLENSLTPIQFDQWKTTNFPSPYSTSNVLEDWAESFTHVILKKYYKTDMIYSLYDGNKEIASQTSCISNGTCPEKRKIVEMFITNPDIFLAE